MFWPRFRHGVVRANTKTGKSRLERIAEGTLKRKIVVAGIIGLVALASFVEFHQTPTGEDLLDLLPNSSSLQGLAVYTSSFGIGSVQIVVTTPTPIINDAGQFNQTLLNDIREITNAVSSTNGVSGVVGLTSPFGVTFAFQSIANLSTPIRAIYESQMMSLIGQNNATTLIDVSLSNSEMSAAAVNSLYGIEKNIQSLGLRGVAVYYAGTTPSTSASDSSLAALLPEIVLLLAAAIYVILFVQLRSAFIPLRLIFTILCSVAMSLAVMSIVFFHALNLPIFDLAPLFAVVTMMGVGIDYDIFFVTRIREEVLNGKSDDEAIKTAVEKMWVTIFGMGLVLFCVFGAEATVKIPLLQEIGFTVAAAIMVDITVVILLFVPALMALVQDLNWWPTKINRKGE
jgi:putative drug exporter of the RND superfamily